MDKTLKKLSIVRLTVELYEEIIILIFLELKRAVAEIKHNVRSVEQGAVMVVLGGGLLLLAALTFIAAAVAALALVLPVWLAALVVALVLAFLGVGFLFGGLGHFKDFTLIPSETLRRAEEIVRRYRQAGAQRRQRSAEARSGAVRAPRAPGEGHATR